MTLKSTRMFGSRKKKKIKRKLSDTGRLLLQGTTALLGVALLSQTADAVARV